MRRYKGEIDPRDPVQLKELGQDLRAIGNKHGVVEIFIFDGARSISEEQRGYFFGCVIPQISQALAVPEWQIKATIEYVFNSAEIPNEDGELVRQGMSISRLNKKQLAELIDNVILWAWDTYDIHVTEADLNWRETRLEKVLNEHKITADRS